MSKKDHVRRRYGPSPYCLYCRRTLTVAGGGISTSATLDHLVPKAAGGKRTVPCCLACNSLKGMMLPREWSAWREQHPEWWRFWEADGRPHPFRSIKPGLPRVYEDDELVRITPMGDWA